MKEHIKGVWEKTSQEVYRFISNFRPPKNKKKAISNSPRYAEFKNVIICNPTRFNIRQYKLLQLTL